MKGCIDWDAGVTEEGQAPLLPIPVDGFQIEAVENARELLAGFGLHLRCQPALLSQAPDLCRALLHDSNFTVNSPHGCVGGGIGIIAHLLTS